MSQRQSRASSRNVSSSCLLPNRGYPAGKVSIAVVGGYAIRCYAMGCAPRGGVSQKRQSRLCLKKAVAGRGVQMNRQGDGGDELQSISTARQRELCGSRVVVAPSVEGGTKGKRFPPCRKEARSWFGPGLCGEVELIRFGSTGRSLGWLGCGCRRRGYSPSRRSSGQAQAQAHARAERLRSARFQYRYLAEYHRAQGHRLTRLALSSMTSPPRAKPCRLGLGWGSRLVSRRQSRRIHSRL